MSLATLFFLIYLAIVVLIGVLASRRETEEAFMIADRRVYGLQLIATMGAGFFDGATLGVYTAYVYQFGLSAIWMFIGLVPGFLAVRMMAPRIKERCDRLGVYTMSEYFYRILDRKNGLIFSLFILINYGCLLIVDLIVSAKVLSSIFPLPYALSVIIGGLVVFSYLVLAGLKAVIKTDFFQMIIMFLMVFVALAFLAGKYTYTPKDLSLFNMSSADTVAFLILGGLIVLADPGLWQRLIAGKDMQSVKNGLAWAAVPLCVLGAVISVVGITTKQFFPDISSQDALVMGFSNLLPWAIRDFGMVMLYAVALSSTDTMTFVISSQFTRDLQNYTTRFSEESMRRLTRIFMALVLAVAIAIAVWNQDIVTIGLTYAGVLVALTPVIIGSSYWKLNPNATFWSLVLGLASVVVLVLARAITPQSITLCLPVSLAALAILEWVLRVNTFMRHRA